ncbi:MAG: CDP-alcohol phosphatidyltransferase family protein [Janthinobacterium lividum]
MTFADGGEPRRFGRVIPIRALIPNAVTVLALCFGLTGVRFGIAGEWDKAVASIVVAGVLDGIDGRIARLLKGTSRFGAELDSLSDVIAFGVAPALIMYLWALQYLPGIGWIVALAHAVTCALRLARFNAGIGMVDPPARRAGFLMGIPAPVGAGLSLSPIFVWLWLEPLVPSIPFGDMQYNLYTRALISAAVMITVAFLMASSLPTYSWGSPRLRPEWRLAALLAIGLFAGALFTVPWMTLSLLSFGYALSVPLALRSARRITLRLRAGAQLP